MVWEDCASGVEVGASIGTTGGWITACWLEIGEEGGVLIVEKVQEVKEEMLVLIGVEKSIGAPGVVLDRFMVGGWRGRSRIGWRLPKLGLGFFLLIIVSILLVSRPTLLGACLLRGIVHYYPVKFPK